MIKLLTGGGFGDAAMSIGKLYSKDAPFSHPISFELTHIETKGSNLLPAIKDFYDCQNIENKVFEIENWDVQKKIRDNYHYELGTHWFKDNVGSESTWEINPFPPLVYDKVNVKTIINIGGGRIGAPGARGFSLEEIIQFDNQCTNLTFVGKTSNPFYEEYKFNNTNLVNKTSVKELVDLVCSCDTYVGYAGFALFLAGLANKNIYGFKTGGDGWDYRVHPKWKVKQVSNVNETIHIL